MRGQFAAPMKRKKLFLCDLLQRREIGFRWRDERQQLCDASIRLADQYLVQNNMIKTIPCIDDSSRSSYMADSNNRGIAAMTHSNRCISLIDTGIMKRIDEISGFRRTVWTLCFHPFDLDLLATGNLGGTVCVFRKTERIRSQSNVSHPITSISFHPKESLIFYAIDNRIVVWDYEEDVKVTEMHAMEESRIKYVKFNPSNDMLITGIRKENHIQYISINDEPDENNETRLISCTSFLDHLMRTIRSIIDNMETNFVNLQYYWRHILMQMTSFHEMLESCTKAQLRPNKYIGDFDISLILMRRRLRRIACIAFNCDNRDHGANETICSQSTDEMANSMDPTLNAMQFILKMYRKETEQAFNAPENVQFAVLADILITIHKIINLDGFSSLFGVTNVNEYQYRLQAWNMSQLDDIHLPDFSQDWRNLITYCYIHNDSTVEISKCGKLIASFELIDSRKIISIHSLAQATLGEYIYSYVTSTEETIMSLSFSPSLDYLLVGIRSSEIFGYFLKVRKSFECIHAVARTEARNDPMGNHNDEVVTLKQSPNSSDVISYLKWSARPGDGIIIGYKTYQLRCLIRR